MQPRTIPLVKGQNYWTSNFHMQRCFKNGHWLYVRNANGQKGYVPLKFLQNFRTDGTHPQPTLLEENPNVVNELEAPIESPDITVPITNANGNPIILDDPLENNTQ